MIGMVKVAAMNTVKDPVKAMSEITRRTIAENQMIAPGKLARVVSAQQTGDYSPRSGLNLIGWVEEVSPERGL